jgi:PAS domain S-box-containing protein
MTTKAKKNGRDIGARDMVYRISVPEGVYEYVSPTSLDVVGYTPEEIMAEPMSVRRVIHPDWTAYLEKQWDMICRGQGPRRFEYQILDRAGGMRWLNQQNVYVRDGNGRVRAMEGIVTDVTALKLAEQEQQRSGERFRTLFEQASDGINIMDGKGFIRDVNPAMCEILGYGKGGILGRHILEFIPGDELERLPDQWPSVMTGEPLLFERVMLARDGSRRILEVSCKFLGRDTVLALYRDVTERKLAEQRLRELSLKVLTAQENERKRIGRELHDDIGQTLSAVKIMLESQLESLRRSGAGDLAMLEKALPYIDGAITETRRVLLDLRPAMLDDLGLVAAARWLCREFGMRHKAMRVRAHIELDEAAVDETRKTVLYRVLQEALNNVAKHSRASSLEVRLARGNGMVRLRVRDDGVGFDPGDASLRGVGIAGMRERVELVSGSFRIEAAGGKGVELLAEIPCA